MSMWKSLKRKGLAWGVAALMCGLLLTGCGGEYAFDENAADGDYMGSVGPSAQMPESKDFALMANAEVTVNSATGRANVLLGNPEENTRNCRVRLVLDHSGQVLYETDVLKPGERVAYAQLDLDAFDASNSGPYEATARFEILNEETGQTIGFVEAGISITIK